FNLFVFNLYTSCSVAIFWWFGCLLHVLHRCSHSLHHCYLHAWMPIIQWWSCAIQVIAAKHTIIGCQMELRIFLQQQLGFFTQMVFYRSKHSILRSVCFALAQVSEMSSNSMGAAWAAERF